MKEPKLRFLADDGSSFPDLKEKCLSDVCEYNKGQSVGINYVGTENMKQDFSGVNDLDSEKEVKGVAYNIGDTLMSNIRPYLKKTWKADVNGVCSTDVLVFHPTGINSDYLYRSISSEKFISYVMTAVKGSKMPRGDKEHIMNYDIKVPCLSEQQKIASLFSELDTLIQSAEKELKGYRELKQGMLQKMFPEKGEKVPEIRFPEFTGDWEQRKLGDVCKTNGRIGFRGYTEKDIITKEAGGVLTFSPTNIVDNQLTIETKNTYITREKYEESPEIMVKNGNILFVKTGSTLGKSALVSEIKEDCTVNPQVVVIKADVELQKILSVVLISASVQKQIAAIKIGGAVPTMTEAELKNIDLILPQSDDEKIKLGEYFSNLDNLIALQQKELDGYKELKKGLLQQMFC